jgi:DNA-binding NarL/FixJ family response regulator
VLVAARLGTTVSDIAQRVFLPEGTVRNYLSAAIGKTGARATEPRPPGRRTSVAGSECTAKVVVCHGASWP